MKVVQKRFRKRMSELTVPELVEPHAQFTENCTEQELEYLFDKLDNFF